jgi:hypothetical protein
MTHERVTELPSLRPVIAEILNGLAVAEYLESGRIDRGARLAAGAQTLLWHCEDAPSLADAVEQRNNLEVELEDLRQHLAKIHELVSESTTKGAAKLVAELLATF